MQLQHEIGPVKVLYLARGNAELYSVVQGYVPKGFELVTIESDDPDELYAKLPDCEVIIVATRKLDANMIEAAKRLRLAVHQGVGYHDTMDVKALKERGIPVAVTPNGTPETVSEHAVMLMLAACRRLPFADSELRNGRYHVNALRLQSRTVAGRTIGYIGMGRIGQATAKRLLGWGTTGIYVDPIPLSSDTESTLQLKRVDLPALLRTADIVTLHVPLTEETRYLINAEALASMKPGAVLINTARGPIVEESALVVALKTAHLGAAGVDVYEKEPAPANHPLAQFHNVVLTPHIAAATRDTFAAKMAGVFANIERFYSGKPMEDQVL